MGEQIELHTNMGQHAYRLDAALAVMRKLEDRGLRAFQREYNGYGGSHVYEFAYLQVIWNLASRGNHHSSAGAVLLCQENASICILFDFFSTRALLS